MTGGHFNITIPKKKKVEFEEALEETGFGKYNIQLIVICGFCLYVSNFEAYSIGYVLPSAECDLNLDSSKKGILSSANFFGVMISCTFWGYMSDVRGRKGLLIIGLLGSVFTSLAGAFTPWFWGLVTFRFINGIFIAGPSTLIFVYFGEFQGVLYKSKATSVMSYFVAFALAALPAFAWILLESDLSFNVFGLYIKTWRIFMLVNAIPTLIVAVVMMALPESPKFLYYSGDSIKSLEILKQMYKMNKGKSLDSFPVESLSEKVYLEKNGQNRKTFFEEICQQVKPLFKMPYLPYTVAASFMQACIFAISAGLFVWYPDILNKLSNARSNEKLTVCEALSLISKNNNENNISDINNTCGSVNSDVFVLNIIIGGAYGIGYIMWGIIVGKIGNKYFFLSCMTISTIGTVLIIFLTSKIYIDIVFITILMIPGICVAILSDWIIDIFPTNVCGMAICISLTSGRIGSITASSLLGILLNWSCVTTFAMYSASLLLCLLVALILPAKN